jgi:hypothetical protein
MTTTPTKAQAWRAVASQLDAVRIDVEACYVTDDVADILFTAFTEAEPEVLAFLAEDLALALIGGSLDGQVRTDTMSILGGVSL